MNRKIKITILILIALISSLFVHEFYTIVIFKNQKQYKFLLVEKTLKENSVLSYFHLPLLNYYYENKLNYRLILSKKQKINKRYDEILYLQKNKLKQATIIAIPQDTIYNTGKQLFVNAKKIKTKVKFTYEINILENGKIKNIDTVIYISNYTELLKSNKVIKMKNISLENFIINKSLILQSGKKERCFCVLSNNNRYKTLKLIRKRQFFGKIIGKLSFNKWNLLKKI